MDERRMIGENIGRLRKRRGYTQLELAKSLNNSLQYVQKIEQQGTLSLKTLIKFSHPLHTAPQLLLPDFWIPLPLNHEDFLEQLYFYAAQAKDEEQRRQIIQTLKKLVQEDPLP
ncbi:helix-turn-helix domain-containing protein [Ammoniphilus sp. 3BR4]|uniref:helix-turn-helix domain-containing protein n=1 Tax=Ammoniphilus sp. 3BR4 TaxID=3158265 RepID=UPI0034652F2A